MRRQKYDWQKIKYDLQRKGKGKLQRKEKTICIKKRKYELQIKRKEENLFTCNLQGQFFYKQPLFADPAQQQYITNESCNLIKIKVQFKRNSLLRQLLLLAFQPS